MTDNFILTMQINKFAAWRATHGILPDDLCKRLSIISQEFAEWVGKQDLNTLCFIDENEEDLDSVESKVKEANEQAANFPKLWYITSTFDGTINYEIGHS